MVSLATSPIIKCDIPNQRQQLLSTDLIDLLVVHHTMFHQDLAKGKLSICGFIFPRAVACLPENTIITMRNHISCNITEKWLADLKSAPMITPKSIKTWKWKIFTIFFHILHKTWNCQELPTHTILFKHNKFCSPRKRNLHSVFCIHRMEEVFSDLSMCTLLDGRYLFHVVSS